MQSHGSIFCYVPISAFVIAFILLNTGSSIAQSDPQAFPVGAFMGCCPTQTMMDSYDNSGMNWIELQARSNTKDFLEKYAVVAYNQANTDWIHHYATGYYSKWESEENQTNYYKVGVKHKLKNGVTVGQYADWYGTSCWSTLSLSDPADSLIYGPHYYQAKTYRRWFYDYNIPVQYTARFNMALDIAQTANQNDPVCEIKVVYRYADKNNTTIKYEDVLQSRILRVSDFPQDGNFRTFDFGTTYEYDINIFPTDQSSQIGSNNYLYTDWLTDTGIEFCVNWLGNPAVGTLYVDYADVFDNDGWDDYIENPNDVESKINYYLEGYTNTEWPNIKYWYVHDEPHSIDAFEPIKVVDEIVRNYGGAPLITHFWEANVVKNGDPIYQHFFQYVNPEKLMFNAYPFHTDDYPLSISGWEILRQKFQSSYELQPDFYFVPQAFGLIYPNGTGFIKPTPAEMRSNVMLALAHGCKGIMFSDYYTYYSPASGWLETIVDDEGNPTDLWYEIHDNLAPRLTGGLGNTLLNLDYTGNFINIEYQEQLPENFTNSFDYLTIQPYGNSYHWHSGFLNQKDHPENKYFLLTNLRTNFPNHATFQIANNTGFKNLSVRDVENASNPVNTTLAYNETRTFTMNFPAGEGYLFQVAPVVKYGGKLVYNETTTNGITLYDKMSIESGATLTVNGTYTANADITVKAGGKLKYGIDNSKIIFNNGAKLILEGNAQVYGTSSTSKLTLQYNSSTSFGVVVNPGASPIISYCNITGSLNGISVENEASINVSNTSISNCSNTGIALFHFGNGESVSTLSTPNIYKCSISNCGTAISAVNCSEVIIKENTITQCNLGLYFNMVNSAYISSNTILGWQSETGSPMPGISMSSSGGYLRNNTIRYHNFGVQLAYSSPDLGMNTIENNYKCGVYSSLGSYPNLVQQLANPECWYPIGGCNVIKNNGTFTQFPPSTPSILSDGAEIFLNSGDVLLSYGYNEISDDRTGIPTYLTIPLIKGTRSTGGSREFFVDHNYWGTVGPSPSRFGTLEADYDPTADYCPLPDAPCSGSELLIQTSDGQIVDTLDSRERETTEISALEENYATADKLFYAGEIEESKTYYLTIVQGNYTNAEKLYAYNKLYEIGSLLKEENSYFTELQNAFNLILEVETDTLLLKAFNQRSILCDVSKEEYVTAINKFDEIIQQNPNSEEAVYAEIDILTTALNIDTTNTQLGKIGGGKYLVKGTSDYLSKLNDILQSKFGVNSDEKEKIIPKEYSLHQNYPNPFNPSTVISWQSPVNSHQIIKIYDILGKEIATLVDEFKEAGIYEITFDASNLASGVYIYKLQAGDFVSSKKMLLLK